jgi:hypothetical protein
MSRKSGETWGTPKSLFRGPLGFALAARTEASVTT